MQHSCMNKLFSPIVKIATQKAMPAPFLHDLDSMIDSGDCFHTQQQTRYKVENQFCQTTLLKDKTATHQGPDKYAVPAY